jgi:hypothetical protein
MNHRYFTEEEPKPQQKYVGGREFLEVSYVWNSIFGSSKDDIMYPKRKFIEKPSAVAAAAIAASAIPPAAAAAAPAAASSSSRRQAAAAEFVTLGSFSFS